MATLMPTSSDVKDDDVLVYVVPSGDRFNSVIAHQSSAWVPNPGRSGLTLNVGSSGVSIVSEVYWDKAAGNGNDTSRLLANLIFHEFMHNKLDAVEHAGVDFVHNQGGGGLAIAGAL